MRYLSLFSGIEAATAAWDELGWECVGVSEIDPYGCALLAQKYPHVPNLGDVTAIDETAIAMLGRIDLLVFGSPCQDLSVAGKRRGFTDEDGELTRSGLFHAAARIIGWARKHCGLRWAVWENVPGAFSSNSGRDFAVVVGELAGLEHVDVPAHGWGNEGCAVGEHGMVEWGTLDAQWFGVAQRRRRCFAVADFGDWAGRQPILLEPARLRGDSAPCREAGQIAAAGTLRSTDGGCDLDHARAGHLVGVPGLGLTCVSNAEGATGLPFLTCSNLAKTVNNQTPLLAFANVGEFGGMQQVDVCDPLRAKGGDVGHGGESIIAFNWNAQPDQMRFDPHVTASLTCSQESAVCVTGHVTHTLKADGFDASEDGTGRGQPIVANGFAVRRLTPMECERLQGFGDNYTHVTYRGKPAADGPRYKALGNSMAVPVMRWIGVQIDMVGLFQ